LPQVIKSTSLGLALLIKSRKHLLPLIRLLVLAIALFRLLGFLGASVCLQLAPAAFEGGAEFATLAPLALFLEELLFAALLPASEAFLAAALLHLVLSFLNALAPGVLRGLALLHLRHSPNLL